MQAAQSEDPPLPPLREDLRISLGAPLLNGAPSWVIYDPIRHRFFQVGQRTMEMISNWSSGTISRLQSELQAKRALHVGAQEIRAVLEFLKSSDLLAETERGLARSFDSRVAKQRTSLIQWALHRYIFFRVPLVRPNNFLQATWPIVRPLFSRGFVILTLLMLFLGLYLASRQFSDVAAHFRAAFSFEGAVTYAVALAFVKIFHEMGHAYQAVARGLRVPVMGVAFIVLFPLLYTDTTDAWRLRTRRDRLMVDLGGILVELSLAVYATVLWCFLPDGAARDAAFAVATVSWVFSLLVNLNPLMRFDGYYLLADALGVHNLQPRSFNMGKWALREAMFGLGEPAPEKQSRRMRVFMTLYCYAIWIYRFFLFIAIALIVYTLFFKALGVILFLAEIAFFIAAPVLRELKVWFGMRKQIARSWRSWLTMGVLLVLVGLAAWPMSRRIHVPAVLDEARQQAIYASVNGQLQQVHVTEGDKVRAGDVLFSFQDPELPLMIEQARQRIALNQARLQAGAGDEVERASRVIVERQLEEERETLSSLLDRQSEMQIRAPHDGVVIDMNTYLQPGTWFGRKEFMGRIVEPGDLTVRGYIQEDALRRLDHDRLGHFIADNLKVPKLSVKDVEIADFSIKKLSDRYLAMTDGGDIPVLETKDEKLTPKGSWYPVTAEITTAIASPKAIQTGAIILHSVPEAWVTRAFSRIAQVLVREADF
ncbi:MAG: hypothetical protein CMI67_20835 [Pelagibaca sp.]|nr:hypothetical protein [Pelagibaca sp.]